MYVWGHIQCNTKVTNTILVRIKFRDHSDENGGSVVSAKSSLFQLNAFPYALEDFEDGVHLHFPYFSPNECCAHTRHG